MIYKKYFPAIVSGFIGSIFTVVPFLKSFGCCLIVPAASILALWFLIKINKNISFTEMLSVKTCLLMGLFTGLAAAVFTTGFDGIVTYFARTNDFIESLPLTEKYIADNKLELLLKEPIDILNGIAKQIRDYGFSGMYIFMSLTGNLFLFSISGLIGGLIGKWFINNKLKRN